MTTTTKTRNATQNETTPALKQPARKTRAQWAEICRSWQDRSSAAMRQTVKALIGLALTKAKRDLDSHGDWIPFLRDELGMEVRRAQRLMRLANNPRFRKNDKLSFLPTKVSALLAIGDMPKEAYEEAKASGAINPSTTAKQAREYVSVKVTPSDAVIVAPYYPAKAKAEARPPSVYRPPSAIDRLLADLESFEERLRAQLEGKRLEMALAGLAQIRMALAEPSGKLVELPKRDG